MRNILSYINDNCYGCALCAVSCGKRIITMRQNKEGFYMPHIENERSCIECGLCIDSCAFLHKELEDKRNVLGSYAVWSNDENVRHICSSGGFAYELGRQLIQQGCKVVAVKYNVNKTRAEHYVAEIVEELSQSVGSKYIQSYTYDAFKLINREDKYLITGTPCQIDSFRRYIRRMKYDENNFILMDFFCHSVPSMYVWKNYLLSAENQVGEIANVSWRSKRSGWHDSWVVDVEGIKGHCSSRLSQGDVFFNCFLKDFCINKSCRESCKYKYDASSADIRIGDFWGKTYKSDEKGVSAVAVFSKKGFEILDSMNNLTIIEHPFDIVAEGQMKQNAHKAYLDFIVKKMVKSEKIFNKRVWTMIFYIEDLLHIPIRVVNKIKRLVSK